MARKEVLVNRLEIDVAFRADTAPSLLMFAAATAVGPSKISVPMLKSVMRSKLARVDVVREVNLNVSIPPRPVIRSLLPLAVSVLAVASPIS